MWYTVVLLAVAVGNYETAAKALSTVQGCTVKISNGLPSPQPLLLVAGGSKDGFGFKLPSSTGVLQFQAGETVRLACPGTGNHLKLLGTSVKEASATCDSNTSFTVSGAKHNFSQLACSSLPSHTARKTGQKCISSQYEEIEIGFEVDAGFYRLISVCFDAAQGNTLYSRFDLVKSIGSGQYSYPRPSTWDGDNFYQGYDPNNRYYRRQQISTIAGILGSEQLASQYISTSSDMYLARGHLTAKADLVYGAEQWATFNYVNVAPQWQSFNAGNWEKIEYSTRRLAAKKGSDMIVYTGTHGVATLPGSDGSEKELYLYVDGASKKTGMPVPRLYWKAVYDNTTKTGVVLLGVNNPYVKNLAKEYVICPDVGDKLSWLTWTRTNVTAGYSYACEVDAFRKVVDTLPQFTVTGLLT